MATFTKHTACPAAALSSEWCAVARVRPDYSGLPHRVTKGGGGRGVERDGKRVCGPLREAAAWALWLERSCKSVRRREVVCRL